MTLSSSDQEMLWIEAWSELWEMIEETPGLILLSPEWQELTLQDAQGLIQDQAYSCRRTDFESTYARGQRAVRLTFTAVE